MRGDAAEGGDAVEDGDAAEGSAETASTGCCSRAGGSNECLGRDVMSAVLLASEASELG